MSLWQWVNGLDEARTVGSDVTPIELSRGNTDKVKGL